LFYKDNLSIFEQKYREGAASSLDREDASLGYQVALFNQKQAIYDYIVAKVGLKEQREGNNEVNRVK